MKILVSGGAGFVGTNLIKRLLRLMEPYYAPKNDLLTSGSLSN